MWIDNRSATIKVYEKNPGDPYVKKLTWDPQENAWVLYSDLMNIAHKLGDPDQTQAAKEWEAGKLSYAEMRMRMG